MMISKLKMFNPVMIMPGSQTRNHLVTSVPVPATAWIVGSGLLGLMGVGATRRKYQLAV